MTMVYLSSASAFTLSALGLTMHRKHLVSALLCIEGMMLALFTAHTSLSQTLTSAATSTQPIVLLTLAACGAGAGLALLVASTRTHSSDHLKSLNLLKC